MAHQTGGVDVAALRLRDPLPAATAALFTAEAPAGQRWVVPAAVLVLVVVVTLLAVL